MYQHNPFRRTYGEFLALAAVLLLLAGACLQGCANMQKPVTPEDYVQETKAQVGAAYKSIADAKVGGQITEAQARTAVGKVQPIDDQVHAVERAMRVGGTGPTTAQYAQWVAALAAVSAELKAMQAAKGK